MQRSIQSTPGRPSLAPAVVEYSVEHSSGLAAMLDVKPVGERLNTVEYLLRLPAIEMLLPRTLPRVRNLLTAAPGGGVASRVVFRSELR